MYKISPINYPDKNCFFKHFERTLMVCFSLDECERNDMAVCKSGKAAGVACFFGPDYFSFSNGTKPNASSAVSPVGECLKLTRRCYGS
jgi:hypothetical protein